MPNYYICIIITIPSCSCFLPCIYEETNNIIFNTCMTAYFATLFVFLEQYSRSWQPSRSCCRRPGSWKKSGRPEVLRNTRCKRLRELIFESKTKKYIIANAAIRLATLLRLLFVDRYPVAASNATKPSFSQKDCLFLVFRNNFEEITNTNLFLLKQLHYSL